MIGFHYYVVREIFYGTGDSPDDSAEDVAAPEAPKVGAVVDGFVFLGGDPSKKESWKKQR